MTDDLEIYHECREAVLAVLARHDVGREHVNIEALLSRSSVRAALIRREYSERRRSGETDSLKYELADKWKVSDSYINKILYSKDTMKYPDFL